MTLSRKLMPALLAMILVMVGMNAAKASEAEDATVVVYRAGESLSTSRIKLNVHMGAARIGRLSSDSIVSRTNAAGEYTLDTTVAGTEPLTLKLQPGQTHFVRVDVKVRHGKVTAALVEVEEQVALVEQPDLESTI